jgi:predicted transcriptional regulator
MKRFAVTLSDDLARDIETAARETGMTMGGVLVKAVQLYLAAQDGQRQGLKIGLVEPETRQLQTEFVGL